MSHPPTLPLLCLLLIALWCPDASAQEPQEFKDQVMAMGGYDVRETGRTIGSWVGGEG